MKFSEHPASDSPDLLKRAKDPAALMRVLLMRTERYGRVRGWGLYPKDMGHRFGKGSH